MNVKSPAAPHAWYIEVLRGLAIALVAVIGSPFIATAVTFGAFPLAMLCMVIPGAELVFNLWPFELRLAVPTTAPKPDEATPVTAK